MQDHVEYSYRDHWISIDMIDMRRGRWHWSYSVDGAGYHESQDRPLGYEAMLNEAKRSAERRVDQMVTRPDAGSEIQG